MRNQRRHEHRAEAYVEALRLLLRSEESLRSTEPELTIGPPKAVEPATRGELELANARVSAFGSKQVKERLRALWRVQTEFFAAVWYYRQLRELVPAAPNAPGQLDEQRKSFDTFRAKRAEFIDGFKALQDLIAKELG